MYVKDGRPSPATTKEGIKIETSPAKKQFMHSWLAQESNFEKLLDNRPWIVYICQKVCF